VAAAKATCTTPTDAPEKASKLEPEGTAGVDVFEHVGKNTRLDAREPIDTCFV
jgi:hypothetical protein